MEMKMMMMMMMMMINNNNNGNDDDDDDDGDDDENDIERHNLRMFIIWLDFPKIIFIIVHQYFINIAQIKLSVHQDTNFLFLSIRYFCP